MQNYKDLILWQEAHNLTLKVYEYSKAFPKDETFGVTSQLRRACVSIACNISEGCGRLSDKELAHFLVIANGSASELAYQLLLSKDLEYISEPDYNQFDQDLTQIRKMLNAFVKQLNSK